MNYNPVIIIGAPRSGTNMLRDVLTTLPGMSTWPCDEINYIWRYGNGRYPSDELTPELARPEVCRYIRGKFDWVARKYQAHTVVEKTCANSLRIGFVDRVVPEAKYIFIRRNGLDAISSTIKRWKAKLDLPYILRKARFVPVSDLSYYASRFILNWIYRLFSKEERLAFWGPKLDRMEVLLKERSLEEVCALQWKRCVEKAALALEDIPGECWIGVEYEKFVTHPEQDLKDILDFLEIKDSNDLIANAISGVSPNSIGKGKKELGKEIISRLTPLIKDTMNKYGYV